MVLHSSPPIRDQLQQIAVRIEEVETIVVSPVNRPLVWDLGLRERCAGSLEIGSAHAEGVMPFAERLIDSAQIRPWEVPPLEQREG